LQQVQGAGEARQRARRALALEQAERLALELRALDLELGELLLYRGMQRFGGFGGANLRGGRHVRCGGLSVPSP